MGQKWISVTCTCCLHKLTRVSYDRIESWDKVRICSVNRALHRWTNGSTARVSCVVVSSRPVSGTTGVPPERCSSSWMTNRMRMWKRCPASSTLRRCWDAPCPGGISPQGASSPPSSSKHPPPSSLRAAQPQLYASPSHTDEGLSKKKHRLMIQRNVFWNRKIFYRFFFHDTKMYI